jgi:hypothetical protein
MIAILSPLELSPEAIRKVLGASVDLREGRHGLPIRPEGSYLCRRGDVTIWVDHFIEAWHDSAGQNSDPDSPLYSDDKTRDLLLADPWCLKRAMEQRRGQREAVAAAERHRQYVLLRVPLQPGGNSVGSFEILLDLARDFLVAIRGAVFFNPRAEVICNEPELAQIRDRYRAEGLPPMELLVNARTFVLPGGWGLADSVGLSQLELPDQEVAFNEPQLAKGEALEFVRNLAKHLITHRTPICNGDTAGGPKGTLWEAMILGQASIAPHRKIIRWLPENREGMPPDLQVP